MNDGSPKLHSGRGCAKSRVESDSTNLICHLTLSHGPDLQWHDCLLSLILTNV